MNYRVSMVDKMLMQKLSDSRQLVQNDLDQSIRNHELCMDQFVFGIQQCEKKGLRNTKLIWNMSALINIISMDLKIIQRDLYFSKDFWAQRYYIRQAYLLIYEFFKSYYSEQKDFYEVINTKLDISLFVAEKDSIIKDLREYRKKYEKVFYNVRNAAVAHREVNIMAQIEVIENLNFSEAIEIILKFNELLNSLGSFLKKVIDLGLKDIDLLK